jgi:tetratricopeptide (TPR) repeat protein
VWESLQREENMKKIGPAVFLAVVLGWALQPAVHAQSSNPQQTLKQYISDLQKNPNDYALREKIIKHVQTMKPAPAIPEEARRYFIEGSTLLKAAKDQKGYGLALDAYRQCLLIAPWWAEALYNYSVALDVANQFDEGMNAFKLYIARNPGETESRKAQDKIYEIGAKKKLAAQGREESSPQAVAVREQSKYDDWLKKIDGRRYTCQTPDVTLVIDVRRKVLVYGKINPQGNYWEDGRVEIQGREATVPLYRESPYVKRWPVESIFIISEDGDRITNRFRWNDGVVRDYYIYLWER